MAYEILTMYPSYSDHTEKGTYGHGFYHSLDIGKFPTESLEYFFKRLAQQERMREFLKIVVNEIFKRFTSEPKLIEELKRTGSEYISFNFKNPYGNRKLDAIFNIHIDGQDRVWVDDCRVKTSKGTTVGRFRQNVAADNVCITYLS